MMPNDLVVLFVLVPMATGIVVLAMHGRRTLQHAVGLAFMLVNCLLCFWGLATVCVQGLTAEQRILVTQIGSWPAPFGISLVLDPLAAIMLAIESIVSLATFIYIRTQLADKFGGGFFHPLFHFLILGVQWSFVTGDLFNLFVAFEIMLLASYAMFVAGTTRVQMRQAYKYILLNLIGSTLFVTCAGLIYGQLGTLNMADITRITIEGRLPAAAVPVVGLLLLVFGGKAAMFPVWYWLPDTYHTMPAAIGGLFAGLLTKVGAYVMVRTFVMMFGGSPDVTAVLGPVIMGAAVVTMFVGVLGAVSMHTVRRILSIHIISQVGYMILGVGLGMAAVTQLAPDEMLDSRKLAVAGGIFFIVHNMVVKCCLFLCGSLMYEHAGSDDLEKIGGLLKRAPWLAVLFLLAALSLAGLPPLSGFFGKWVLIKECFHQERYTLAGFGLATSLLTLLSMLKIWSYGFWSPAAGRHVTEPARRPNTAGGMVAVALLVGVALSMGLAAQSYLNVAKMAAESLVNPRPYIAAVLGPEAVRVVPVNPEQHASTQQRSTTTPDTTLTLAQTPGAPRP